MKSEKPTYSESGTPIYQKESGLSPDLEHLMCQLLDEQNYCPELNMKLRHWNTDVFQAKLADSDFNPMFMRNERSKLWECFPEKITKKNRNILEMINKNPSEHRATGNTMASAFFKK